jgi:hypothetical protein
MITDTVIIYVMVVWILRPVITTLWQQPMTAHAIIPVLAALIQVREIMMSMPLATMVAAISLAQKT